MIHFTTVRLINRHREIGGEWFVNPSDTARLAWCVRESDAFRAGEPNTDWHLETRGTVAIWHRMEEQK